MLVQPVIFAAALAVGVALVPLSSEARVYVDVGVAPPPARVEVVPAPRHGYVWAPGYYVWNGRAHVWHGGAWMRERRGYHWVASAWVPAGPRWHYQPGHWVR